MLGGRVFFEKHWILCKLIAIVCNESCSGTIMAMTLLAFNRYISVCHHARYSAVFSRRNTLLFCLTTWTLAFLISLPNYTGMSSAVKIESFTLF